ncbi:MAG: glycosyltransferase family 4 protein [Pirellulaceae bacterium]
MKLLSESSLGEQFGYHVINNAHGDRSSGVHRIVRSIGLAVWDILRFRRALSVRSIGLLHIVATCRPHRINQYSLFVNWARKCGWKIVLDIRAGSLIDFVESASSRQLKKLDRLILGADAVTVEGAIFVEFIMKRWGVHAVHMPNFIRWEESGGRYCADSGAETPPLRIVYTGRLHRDKGIVELAEAVASIHSDVPIELDLIGPVEGDAELAVRAIIGRHQLQNSVHLRGGMPKADLLQKLAEGHIWALPTYHRSEGHSNALTEAMGLGLAIVSCPQGFIADVLGPEGGVLVPHRDSAALANALKKLAESPALRRQLGERARQRARSHYSDEIVIPLWADIYRNLLRRSSPAN